MSRRLRNIRTVMEFTVGYYMRRAVQLPCGETRFLVVAREFESRLPRVIVANELRSMRLELLTHAEGLLSA